MDNSNDTPVECVCGCPTLYVAHREGLGYYAQCFDCNRRFRLRDDQGATAPETGKCINCGCYFDSDLGASHDVCSERCGNVLAAEFNRMLS